MWIPISPEADEDLQWWMSGHNVLMVNPQGSRCTFVHGCIEHMLGCALELLHSLQCLVDNRESTSHQCARVRGRSRNSAPLAEAAHGPNSSCCVGQLHGSILHQQAGWDMVNITVQTDQEVTPHVPEQQVSPTSTSHSRKNECSRSCPISANSDNRLIYSQIFCFTQRSNWQFRPLKGIK